MKIKRALNLRTILTAGVAVASIGGGYYYQNMVRPSYSLANCLDHYGFKTPEQKLALEGLMRNASILDHEQTLEERFPTRHKHSEVVGDLVDFVKLTQEHFFRRKSNQERWEISSAGWMEQNHKQNLQYLTTLGFIERVYPKSNETDLLCPLGATKPTMGLRVGYAELLLAEGLKASSIALLTGERKSTIGPDGSKDELENTAKNLGRGDLSKLFEVDLMRDLYQHSTLPSYKLPTYFIDTPAGSLPRANTYTTLVKLSEFVKEHPAIKSIVFVSNQPHAQYQQAVISSVFKQTGIGIKFEVVGPAVQDQSKIQPLIEGLGTFIWAKTPAVINKLGQKISDPTLVISLKELYEKQPLMWQEIEESIEKNAKQGRSR
jgi:hypothetical protein